MTKVPWLPSYLDSFPVYNLQDVKGYIIFGKQSSPQGERYSRTLEHRRVEEIQSRYWPLLAHGPIAKLIALHTENTVIDIDDATWLDHFGNVLVIDIPIVLVRKQQVFASEHKVGGLTYCRYRKR